MKKLIILIIPLLLFGCTSPKEEKIIEDTVLELKNIEMDKKNESKPSIIFLHHSTGENIWNGGVEDYLTDYNITEQNFPKDSPYGWENYPYDYWNIWVNNAGDSEYLAEPTLEILTEDYDVIMFKHCYPGAYIEADTGSENIGSSSKSLSSYKLQYNALKEKMHEFPDAKFIVWTLAAQIEAETDKEHATRAEEFVNWVKDEWDEEGDNIYVFDFWQLETEGGLYLKTEYSDGDSHPNASFSETVAPKLAQSIIDIIENND